MAGNPGFARADRGVLLQHRGARGPQVQRAAAATISTYRGRPLTAAAVAQWPAVAAVAVRVLYDVPMDRTAIKKMFVAPGGTAVSIGRLHDDRQTLACQLVMGRPAIWDWLAEARNLEVDPGVLLQALAAVEADALADRDSMADAPPDALPRKAYEGTYKVSPAGILGPSFEDRLWERLRKGLE
eukprot:CAMPEP_0168507170 /NCGR_PEP_ID=MMETSP0228-20121227/77744_1 /TAXON_ID=133427 /ORGANISM="Protoceratium reticulatum, Strain CCCM 535 (=CCMP 1889)" /LENGTH=183 /DNA_ID=CAMNT_0008524271 /DNA_START=80 /DNA_END=630 /DNA_ORIENTATION=+